MGDSLVSDFHWEIGMKRILIYLTTAVLVSCTTEVTPTLQSEAEVLYLDTTFIYKDVTYQLLVDASEDRTTRVLYETYQCESDGIKSTYGKEYAITLKQGEKEVFTTYLNIDIVRKLSEDVEDNVVLGGLKFVETNRINQLIFEAGLSISSWEGGWTCVIAIDMKLEE